MSRVSIPHPLDSFAIYLKVFVFIVFQVWSTLVLTNNNSKLPAVVVYETRHEKHVFNKAVYLALAINVDGQKNC